MWIEKSDVMVGQDPAWYFPAREAGADTTAIVVHGQNGNRSNGMRFVGPAYTAGMSVLYILSVLHVLLEFPLNHRTFAGIGVELRALVKT